jgi:hypothetical protein
MSTMTDYRRWTDSELLERLLIEASLGYNASGIDLQQIAHEIQHRRRGSVHAGPDGHFDVQYAERRGCWCGGQDGEHVADAHAEEGRW